MKEFYTLTIFVVIIGSVFFVVEDVLALVDVEGRVTVEGLLPTVVDGLLTVDGL